SDSFMSAFVFAIGLSMPTRQNRKPFEGTCELLGSEPLLQLHLQRPGVRVPASWRVGDLWLHRYRAGLVQPPLLLPLRPTLQLHVPWCSDGLGDGGTRDARRLQAVPGEHDLAGVWDVLDCDLCGALLLVSLHLADSECVGGDDDGRDVQETVD